MAKTYCVIFTGHLLPGFTLEAVRKKAGERLGLDDRKLDILFSGQRLTLKRKLDIVQGEGVRRQYTRLGMSVVLEKEASDSPNPFPLITDRDE